MSRSPTVSDRAEEWIHRFIDDLATHEDLNPKTLRDYASDLRHFAVWVETGWNNYQEEEQVFHPSEITTPTLIRYREYMQTVRSFKPATINRRLITIKRYFEWAVKRGVVPLNPAQPVKLVAAEKTSPRQMTDQEEAVLVAAVQRHGTIRERTIILLMLHTGLRTMEVCDLRCRDVVLGKRSGRLMVRSGKRNKQREVPLNVTIRTALEEYLATQDTQGDDYLFRSEKTGGRLGERALRHLIQKYMRLAGLEGLSAHDLRHRFGYVMAERTPLHRLAQIMGHDSLDTTMIYVQATRSDLQAEVEKIAWQ
ncbi:integrase/recombinase XerC [Melghirimyces profundicolus]|uniref:Integrase/recombinase XerC n=1 Tax=Melghirimyces profundicolus TaxID=1242148 RepID=A0A2T6BGB8_9BACL|nr:tyrosine-type recombinase/integrase [Melghirimyces profundicolus]PTX55104.1 integrase/recombinase XerC [Melghirimyces profundicolus]